MGREGLAKLLSGILPPARLRAGFAGRAFAPPAIAAVCFAASDGGMDGWTDVAPTSDGGTGVKEDAAVSDGGMGSKGGAAVSDGGAATSV
ncbi:MAG: hypothetical protein LBD12_04250, partial [Clostridiales Family XIII bacterium]|nr:hypothetical protein [Clostridiales Family XIII bacterium]